MGAMGRHILFSGCAATHDRRPVRDAMLGLAKELHLELQESPIAACCGARAAQANGAPNARHLLLPLLALSEQGQDIACLSPACRCALTAHLTELARSRQAMSSGAGYPIPQVRDIVELLSATANGPNPLRSVPRRLSFLQVALHAACHGDHNPAGWPQAATPVQVAAAGDRQVESSGPGVADSALANLVAATGARILQDVSVAGRCAGFSVPRGRSQVTSEARPAARCLAQAAEVGAEALITPCIICYTELQRHQRTLDLRDRARSVRVLHLAQLLNLACTPGPIVWVYGAQQL